MTDSSAGKLETLGSSFSNETALAGCLRLNATIRKILSIHKKEPRQLDSFLIIKIIEKLRLL